MITVASFTEPYKAQILQGRLLSEGIPSEILDSEIASINWMYSNAVGGVKVNVDEEYVEDALRIIGDKTPPEYEAGSRNAVCPHCGSTAVGSTHPSKLWLILSLILLVPFFFRTKKWKCGDCGRLY